MTIRAKQKIDGMQSPAGPLQDGKLVYVRGELVLVAGVATENISDPGMSGGNQPTVILQRRVSGGTIGELTYVYAGGVLTINSANALDTSTVVYIMFGGG